MRVNNIRINAAALTDLLVLLSLCLGYIHVTARSGGQEKPPQAAVNAHETAQERSQDRRDH
jgi:hypothetical protein